MINSIHLKNFKSFDDTSLLLSNLNFLTGMNSAGKSSVIQSVLSLLQRSKNSALELNGPLVELGTVNDIFRQDADADGIEIEMQIGGNTYQWKKDEAHESFDKVSTIPLCKKVVEALPTAEDVIYLSAERWGPRNNVPIVSSSDMTILGKFGEKTLNKIHIERNLTLGPEDLRRHESLDEKKGLGFIHNINAWMSEISPGVMIQSNTHVQANAAYATYDFGGKLKGIKAQGVGFGLSYALSIVCGLLIAKKGSLVIIENPEAHIHPRGQSKLGQLMALAAQHGVQVLCETHSEHIINGARVQVRLDKLEGRNLKIFYFDRSLKEQVSTCEELTVNELGQISNWPSGFFDQQAKDMETLIKGR